MHGRILSAGFGVIAVVFALGSSCSPAPPPTTDFDIKLVEDSTQSIAFGRNILSTDKDFLVTESSLGVTPFISLAPPLEFTPSGITAHFKSSFARTDVLPGLSDNQCPWAKSGSNCSFPSDAELQLFTRDPNELHDTLLTDDGWNYDFLFDSSTQRSYPTGEAVGFLNPTPYSVPAAVVMDVDGPPADTVFCFKQTCVSEHLNQPALDPVVSTYAWERSTNTGTYVANMNLWGSPASQPSGFGSIKAVRLAQHGPCELEFPLQAPLNTLKEQVVQGLEQCYQDFGGNAAGGQILDLDILSFDAIPYVANQPSPQGFNVPESTFGILVHGNIELTASEEVGGVPIATSPCDGSFVFDYRASVANGALQVKIANSGGLGDSAFAGGGQGQVGDPENVCTYLRNLLIGDSQGNGLNGQPPLLTKVALGQLQTAIQNAVQGSFLHVANGAFTMDVSTLALDSGDPSPSDAMCHHAGTHPSCRGVEPFLLPVAVKGAQLFNPSLDETQATAALVGTFEGGIDSPDVGNGNWTCDVNDHCNLKLPLSRLIGQPDAVDIVPFESFTDFSNPSLLAFFMLEAFDSPLAPAKNLCTRRPVAARPGGFYNRLYSSVHVRNASCGNKDEYARWNHEPAQQNESCTTDQDCCNLDPTYCDPDTLKLDVCKNGRCDFNNAYACQNGAWCFPWDECKFDTRAGRSGCVPIGSCQPDDPFRFGICPAVPFNGGTVATYCNNNGECWRQ